MNASDPSASDPSRTVPPGGAGADSAVPEDSVDAQLRKFQKELSAGTVSLALLAVLGAAAQPMYGYQIAKTLERHGEGALSGKQSALYPVLRNLEAAGLLESYVEPSISGPPRRYYAITELGRRALVAWTAAWTATRDSVDSVLKGNLS
jgi:PadR family transcriptional regulator PadR